MCFKLVKKGLNDVQDYFAIDGKTALVVPPRSPEELANAVFYQALELYSQNLTKEISPWKKVLMVSPNDVWPTTAEGLNFTIREI